MKNLQALIRSEMDERGLTYRAVAKRALEQGYKLSHATVTNYVSGKTRTYTRESLIAIAAGLGTSPDRLLRAAEMPMLGEPFELPAEAALLEPHERDAVRSVVSAFIQNRQSTHPTMDEIAGGLEGTRRQMERTGQLDEEVGNHEDSTAPMSQADVESAHREKYGLAAKEALDEPLGQDHTGSP